MQSTYESLSLIPHDALAEKVGGKFKLTRLIAQRLRDLNNGAPLLVERGKDEALLAAVCREIFEDKISLEIHTPVDTDTPAEDSFEDYLGIEDDDN